MKNAILGLTVLTILFIASCSKNPTAGGTWTFKGLTYDVTTCIAVGNNIGASSSANNNINTFGGLTVYFPGPKLPTASGTYLVVDTTPVGNQVFISATVGGAVDTAYTSNGLDSQKVAVTVSNGKIAVSGSNISLINSSVSPAAFPLTFNIYN
jgi:hypothetical protein